MNTPPAERAVERSAACAGGGWGQARNILCIRLDNLGDVLMTTPALRALKQSAPGRRLSLLCSPSGARLAPHLDCVDEVLPYQAPWMKNTRGADPAPDLAMIETLRAARFDAAAIFTVYSQSALPAALMCMLAGIPRILAHARENPYRLLTHWIKDDTPLDGGRHETRRQLDLAASVGAACDDESLAFALRAEDRQGARDRLARHGIGAGERFVVVHPGATAPSRRYPPERFAVAVRLLSKQMRVVLTGDAGERELAGHVDVLAGRRAVNLAGQLALGELGALLADAEVLVSNNSGPVHIAAAVGTPVADLYALTNPQHAPWGVAHRLLNQDVPCKYCYRSICPEGHHACLAGVEPATVAAAAFELAGARRRSSSDSSSPPPGHARRAAA
ncbi:Lipopolysaccharide core heptosyltransferase RfaQ [Pigmentiphaga humi]|uniref:Lipopolysaccharide core heptosyltransferase RfaQ n=1 Tax=Pigmentiphaga humi TaxID=2478468 RepID=A0A3P4B494_9BURK|nr:glycosyltransferase family 9 protein [Pigmentiphaga humi]VCU69975.1 Lipopolysaccharide core heptosyltransferase RfaQ [Pigmentiphaga humi]